MSIFLCSLGSVIGSLLLLLSWAKAGQARARQIGQEIGARGEKPDPTEKKTLLLLGPIGWMELYEHNLQGIQPTNHMEVTEIKDAPREEFTETLVDYVVAAATALAEGKSLLWVACHPHTGGCTPMPVSPYWESYETNGKIYSICPENTLSISDSEIPKLRGLFHTIWEEVRIRKTADPALEAIAALAKLSPSNEPTTMLAFAILVHGCQTLNRLPNDKAWTAARRACYGRFLIHDEEKYPKWGCDPLSKEMPQAASLFAAITEKGEIFSGCRKYVDIKLQENGENQSFAPTPQGNLFPYQQNTYEELEETFLDFKSPWEKLPAKPRWHRLLIGRTGTGKTHLASQLAARHKQPFLAITSGSWIVLGGSTRGAEVTWTKIVQFLRSHKEGIIFIDEIDKINTPDSWASYLRVEVFSLLDGTLPAGVTSGEEEDSKISPVEKEALAAKLRKNFFVIGAGAFQDTLESLGRAGLGFGGQNDGKKMATHQDLARVLPRELVNRFGEILPVPFPNKEDYDEMVLVSKKHLPSELKPHFDRAVQKLQPAAMENQMGARFVEIALSHSIRSHRKENETTALEKARNSLLGEGKPENPKKRKRVATKTTSA